MSTDELLKEEQRETARELTDILRLAQEMGRRLANETHGEMYDDVRLLVSLLHQARAQADVIDAKLNNIDAAGALINKRQQAS